MKIKLHADEEMTIFQLLGFILIAAGIPTIVILGAYTVNPSIIALVFFAIMIGYSMAFPSLLEGNDGLSTMRIVVFMMINVICMLLIKLGWNNDIHRLSDMGIDEYWMGIIAFVFGAKAAQSFFESKLAIARENKNTDEEAVG